jgi:hypothetical protein
MYLTLRIGGTPLYAITDWTLVESTERGESRLVYRPGWPTILRRLIASLICVVLIVVMAMTFGLPPRIGRSSRTPATDSAEAARVKQAADTAEKVLQDLRRTIPAGQWEELERKAQHQRAEREKRQDAQEKRHATVSIVGKSLYWTAFGLLTVVALLTPAPWQRVIAEGDPRKGLRVTKTLFWPRTRACPPGSIVALSIVALEWWHIGRYDPTFLGWRWEVRILGFDHRTEEPFTLEFWPDLQRSLPRNVEVLTPRVRVFVEAVERLTGLRAAVPVVQLSHHREQFGHRMPPPTWEGQSGR